MVKIITHRKKGFHWYNIDGCWVRGYFHDSKGKIHSAVSAAKYFSESVDYEDFNFRVEGANGIFSVVLERNGQYWVAVDLIRSLPLFYARHGNGWIVSDDAFELGRLIGELVIDEEACLEFRGTGYITGSDTLFSGIKQVRAGECLSFSGTGEPVGNFHHDYLMKDPLEIGYTESKNLGIKLFKNTFKRLVESLDGRTAVIPLSGGFDSRFIAVMLKESGYKDVICFTYGRKNNEEQRISAQVAKRLGFQWHFIEYNQSLIDNYLISEAFKEYYPWAANYASMFFMQEYFAVRELKSRNLIPENSVFISGHSGDFLGGSQYGKHNLPEGKEPLTKTAQRIFRVKYHYHNYSNANSIAMLQRIHQNLNTEFPDEFYSSSVHENWDLKEKLSKFNGNSTSTYTFFGYDFRLPYWDRELVEFFRTLPYEFKMGKKLYDDILKNVFFDHFDLNFHSELQADLSTYKMARVKKMIKKFIPKKVIQYLSSKDDPLFYREITEIMDNDLKYKGIESIKRDNRYNRKIIQWYLASLNQ